MVSEYESLRRSGVGDELLAQFSDPRQAEMLTRWDMVSAPPDILVTNYSMLNAMLMRDLEDPLFDSTRDWVRRHDGVFTLVVDELHLYRGTAGSEVAMIIRNLLSRLGLAPDSPNLRCIGTSASLSDDASGLAYLEAFFGLPRSSFYVTAGTPRQLEAQLPLSREEVLHSVAGLQGPSEPQLSLAWASASRSPQPSPRPVERSGAPGPELRSCQRSLSGSSAGQIPTASPWPSHWKRWKPSRGRQRASPSGLICSPGRCVACGRAPTPAAIGWRAGEPCRVSQALPDTCVNLQVRGRILELLYCYECGDVSLGGYIAGDEEGTLLLTSTPVDIPAKAGDFVFRRPHSLYVWYRPGRLQTRRRWSHVGPDGSQVELAFAEAAWDPMLGALTPGASSAGPA